MRAPLLRRAFAWTGAALFAASLLYFLFSYAVTFGEIVPGPLEEEALAANLALFTAFALHHSIFARTPIRNLVGRVVSPGLERSCYVWIASLMLIAVCRLWQPLPGTAWQWPDALRWLPPVVLATGVVLTLRSAAILDIWDLAGVRQEAGRPEGRPPRSLTDRRSELANGTGRQLTDRNEGQLTDRSGGPSGPPDIVFKTDGPYGWVRHPIYLGWFLLVFGVGTMTMTRLVFAVVSGAYILIAIPFEETTLRRAAPDAYGEYMRQVRWRLVPYIY